MYSCATIRHLNHPTFPDSDLAVRPQVDALRRFFATVACACLFVITQPLAAQALYDVGDPWEGYNRSMFELNQGVDSLTTRPLAEAYSEIPEAVRDRITNAFSNMDDVPTMLNNLMQGKVRNGVSDFVRVLTNSSVGLLGMFDVASKIGFRKHEEDFAQTMGVWGIGGGTYVIIPILGPSSVRDFPAFIVNTFMNPTTYLAPGVRNVVTFGRVIDGRADLLGKEEFIKMWSKDYYQAVREYYKAQRETETRDGKVDESIYDYEIELETITDEADETEAVEETDMNEPAAGEPVEEPAIDAPANDEPGEGSGGLPEVMT